MKIIRHRVNQIKELEQLDPSHGVEIDLRSDLGTNGKIHLSHDPWIKGDDFHAWLDVFCQKKIKGTLVLNTKEDGLETKILEMLQERKITDYFFLDTAIPTLIQWTQSSTKFALRASQYESEDFIQQFKKKCEWVWVDCFGGVPIAEKRIEKLSKDFKLCLVSPELQKKSADEIKKFKHLRSYLTAVCTKFPESWID